MASIDSLKTRRELTVGDKTYVYYSFPPPRKPDFRAFRACRPP